MKWFAFSQSRDVRPHRGSFTITDRSGHYVLIQASSPEDANRLFPIKTGVAFDYFSSVGHCPWEALTPYAEGSDEPEIAGEEFLADPNPMLARMGRYFITPEDDFQVNLYPSNEESSVIRYTQEDMDVAMGVWRKGQPKLWAVIVNSNYVSGVRRVVQSRFDPDQYYDRTGNFGGEMTPEQESGPTGWDYRYFASKTKKKVEAYRDGAKRIYHAAVAGASTELEKVKTEEVSDELVLGASRAFTIIKNIVA